MVGDFNSAKYSDVWQCFIENDGLEDALHASKFVGLKKNLQLQFTFHNFRGLQMNSWYMRAAQYLFFGFSHSVGKWLRDVHFNGVCCMGTGMHRQIFRRREWRERAGVHHIDWILYDGDRIERVDFFDVVTYHHMVGKSVWSEMEWSLKWLFYDRIVSKTVYPSDHFPIIAGFKINSVDDFI